MGKNEVDVSLILVRLICVIGCKEVFGVFDSVGILIIVVNVVIYRNLLCIVCFI